MRSVGHPSPCNYLPNSVFLPLASTTRLGSSVTQLLSGLDTNSILFRFLFVKKIIDLAGGQINETSSGKRYSLLFLPATPTSLSRTQGLLELTRRPSRALESPRALLSELQRYKDNVRCTALGAEVPGHRQQQLTQTLIVRL